MKTWKPASLSALALAALAFSSCGDTGSTDGGSALCSGDSQCKTTEICHPTAKVCVQACMTSTDCPSSSPNCAALPDGTAKVCNCTTTNLCNSSNGPAAVCSTVDQVCTPQCSDNAGCPAGRTCYAATGQCLKTATDGGTDGGEQMDAGTDAGMPCTLGSCTGGKVCSFATSPSACETPKTCSSTTPPQPDVCGYGQQCTATTCAEVSVGSCSNFSAGATPLLWNPATASGPVIFKVTKTSFGTDATFCGTNTVRAKIHVNAYAKTAVLLSETNQPGLTYVRTDHNEAPVGASQIQAYTSKAGGKEAEFDVNFCAPTGTTSLTVGLYYDNGPAACFTAN